MIFDEEPVGSLSAGPIVMHPDEDPATMEALAFKSKLQVALRQSSFGRNIALGRPETTIPQLNSAPTVLAFGNSAFEIAIIEGMIFDFDR